MPFRSVLVANRGEIAVRIIRTLRRMGIRSVVTASIPDRRSLAVRSADAWVLLEGYSAAETYLDIEAIISAAKAEGCEAIHPGYGFLSERPDFAEACAAAGLAFIGPPPAVLRALGDKVAARRLAVENGVPVIPGWDGSDDDETLIHQATHVGFPVMIKARGGGGGRGMREVHDPHLLGEALESARREALAAFGDPRLFIEKLITDAHHVEVQIVADAHGNVIHLGERDCSVQRRHQKLIEETPSPVVDDVLRAELTGAALRMAHAIGYVNAGTFEFLVGPPLTNRKDAKSAKDRRARRPYYFLEVNPRLQVEHPVTEMVTGLDLVELQVRVAAGEPLPLRQEDVKFEGHAIEFRINAEDPWDGFKPSAGRITQMSSRLRWGEDGFLGEGTRDDSGYEEGDVVPAQYDSLIMKRIVRGEDRGDALDEAMSSLGGEIRGTTTNRDLHLAVVRSPEFRAGGIAIEWLGDRVESLLKTLLLPDEWWAAAALGLTLCHNEFEPRSRSSPFTRQAGWAGAGHAVLWLSDGGARRHAEVRLIHQCEAVVWVDHKPLECRWSGKRVAGLVVGPEKTRLDVSIAYHNIDSVEVSEGDRSATFHFLPPPPLPRRPHGAEEGATAIVAPLAGTVAVVKVAVDDAVEVADLLVVIEAMKMEHRVVAPVAGTVKEVRVREGDVVREGDLLVELG